MTEAEFIDATIKDQAARAMLAVLKGVEDYVQAFRDGDADICLTRLRAAITQAEAAGIKVDG